MEREALIISYKREDYCAGDLLTEKKTTTVGSLMEELQRYDKQTPILLEDMSDNIFSRLLLSRMDIENISVDDDDEE